MKERNMNEILKPIFTACCLVSICTSCVQQEEEVYTPSEGEVSFISSIHASSRATATTFETDDAISVFAFTGSGTSGFASESYATNKKYIYRNTRFVASGKENAIVYPTSDEALSFQAIYPYGESAGSSFVFNVREDQSQGLNYTLSDLMTASVAATTEASPSLRFSHRLSNIVFTLSFDVAPAGTTQVTFQNVRKAASVDMLTGTFAGTGESGNVKAAVSGTNSYKAVLPPQTVEAGAAIAVITTEAGDTYTWKMPKGTVWKSGIQYAYTLTIDKQGEVTFTSEINPWEEDEEIELGGKLVVRASGSSGYSTFIHRPTEEAESFLVDTCYEYSDFGVDGPFFELYIGNYSPEQHLYTGIDCWISNASMGYPVFTGRNEGEPGDVSAKLNREGMNMRVSLSGRGDLTTSSQVTIPANIVSGEYLLPLSFVGTMKKNIQSISELNFPDVAFELPVPVDEAMVITEGGKYTRGGDLYYREGSLARYEEMKQKMETAGFILQEEENPSGNEWRDGVWMKGNVLIIMYFDSQGMETIISGGTDYHLSIAVVEVSRSTARSANSFAPHMNRMKKLRLR